MVLMSAALRRLGGRLALLASLSGAIGPAVGQTLQAQQGGGRAEVCTATGSRWVALAEAPVQTSEDPGPAAASAHEGHCALCSAAGAALFLPAHTGTRTGPSPAAFWLPSAAAAAPPAPDPWRTGSPRGPPLHA